MKENLRELPLGYKENIDYHSRVCADGLSLLLSLRPCAEPHWPALLEGFHCGAFAHTLCWNILPQDLCAAHPVTFYCPQLGQAVSPWKAASVPMRSHCVFGAPADIQSPRVFI